MVIQVVGMSVILLSKTSFKKAQQCQDTILQLNLFSWLAGPSLVQRMQFNEKIVQASHSVT